nr:efflux RND transporter periplasmic adaptor subunit [Pseudomonas sp.]
MKPTKKKFLRYLLIAAVLIAAAVAVKILFFSTEPPPQFTTADVVRGDLENSVLATGTIEAYKLVSVGAQASGQLKSLKVELGEEVSEGQLIAEIDSMTQQNALRNAEAALETVRAQRAAQVASLKQAEKEFQRQKRMLALDASSRQDYEAAEASLGTIRAQIAALDAEIKQATIAVDTAKVNLGYTQITAPMAGTVVAVIAQEGQTLNANQQAPTIIKLAQLDTLTVKAQISEADVIRVRPGQEVYFTILGDPDKRYYATLRSVEPAPESIATETSSSMGGSSSSSSSTSAAIYYNGLFDVPNPDGTLRISMTAQVYIVLDKATDAVLVPASALRPARDDPRQSTVQVLNGQGEPERRRVKVGINNNIQAQILEGLEPGDRVITGSGQPGQPQQQRRMPRMRL